MRKQSGRAFFFVSLQGLTLIFVTTAFSQQQPPPQAALDVAPCERLTDEDTYALESIEESEPESPYKLYLVARVYRRATCIREAAHLLEEAIKSDTQQSVFFFELGSIYNELRNYKRAIEVLKQAIALDHTKSYYFNEIGYSYNYLKRYPEGIAACERAIELNPKDAYPYSLLAKMYSKQNKTSKALPLIKKTIELAIASKQVAPLSNAATAYMELGKYKEAVETFEKVLEIDPSYVTVHFQLANAYILCGRYEDAVRAYQTGLSYAPNQPLHHIQRAYAYFYLGEHDKAAFEAERMLEAVGWQDKSSPYSALLAYISYALSGNERDADRVLNESLSKLDPDVWPYPIFKFLNGEINERELLFQGGLRAERTQAKTYIGLSYLKRGDVTNGIEQLKWVINEGDRLSIEYTFAIAELKRSAKPEEPSRKY